MKTKTSKGARNGAGKEAGKGASEGAIEGVSKGTSEGANERILGRPSGDLECKIDQSLLQKLTQNERICGVCKI